MTDLNLSQSMAVARFLQCWIAAAAFFLLFVVHHAPANPTPSLPTATAETLAPSVSALREIESIPATLPLTTERGGADEGLQGGLLRRDNNNNNNNNNNNLLPSPEDYSMHASDSSFSAAAASAAASSETHAQSGQSQSRRRPFLSSLTATTTTTTAAAAAAGAAVPRHPPPHASCPGAGVCDYPGAGGASC